MKEENRVNYISGGKSRLTLDHRFTNHVRLFVKFTPHILILAFMCKTLWHPPFESQFDSFRTILR